MHEDPKTDYRELREKMQETNAEIDMAALKLCKDCEYCRHTAVPIWHAEYEYTCSPPLVDELSLIDGSHQRLPPSPCSMVRYSTVCGPEGKLFKAKISKKVLDKG